MSTTKKFIMPKQPSIGQTDQNGVQLNRGWYQYLAGVEDVTGRVANYVDPSTATTADVVNALIAAKLMKPS